MQNAEDLNDSAACICAKTLNLGRESGRGTRVFISDALKEESTDSRSLLLLSFDCLLFRELNGVLTLCSPASLPGCSASRIQASLINVP